MANIIINNYCNQKCDYCFAWKNMEDPSLKNEMDMLTFLYCLKHLKNIWDDRVRILWWEPLLHTKIIDIFKISVKAGFVMTTFSNLKIPLAKWEKILDLWDDYDYSRLKFNLNLNDESFYHEKELSMIYDSLWFLQSKGCDIVVSYNVYEYSGAYDFIFDIAKRYGSSSVVLKVTNTIIGDEEIIDTNAKKYGDYLCEMVEKYYQGVHISFSCGLSKSIFSASQREFLTETAGIKLLYGCDANGGKYDINTDGSVYRCFPLQALYNSQLLHISQTIFQKKNKTQIRQFLDNFVPRKKWLIEDGNCLGNQMNKLAANDHD